MNDKNPLVRIATIRPYNKKILDVLSNDEDNEVRKAVVEAKAKAQIDDDACIPY